MLAVVLAAAIAAMTAVVPVPHLKHAAVIVMENEEAPAVLQQAPWLRGAARRGARATHVDAAAHPSLPNYLNLISGSTQGVSDDDTSRSVRARSLVDQLRARHVGWRAYMEGMPRPCYQGAESGRYAKKHNPFLVLRTSAATCAHVVPATRLARDERRGLPRFVWLTPDLCHDMHDCPVATGDRYLARTVPPLLRALGPRGALIVTFDEGSSDEGGGGRVLTLVLGGAARRGALDPRPLDHRAVLATVEDALGLGRLPATANAPTLGALLKR